MLEANARSASHVVRRVLPVLCLVLVPEARADLRRPQYHSQHGGQKQNVSVLHVIIQYQLPVSSVQMPSIIIFTSCSANASHETAPAFRSSYVFSVGLCSSATCFTPPALAGSS